MDHRIDSATSPREEIDPLSRFVRLALVVYLSPVILTVLAIGLIGVVVEKIGKPAAKVSVEGLHSAHQAKRPLALTKVPAQVREKV